MDVTLSPEALSVVEQKLSSGQFATPEEVVTEALLVLAERSEQVRAAVATGEAALSEGRWTPIDDALWIRIRSRYAAPPTE